ncbi:MAG: haloacid dehalogenase [Egibacteraceae bacterium]
MLELSGLAEAVRARLEAKHQARELALRESRHATRCSANAIRATHRGEYGGALALLAEAEAALQAARAACADEPEVEFAGFLADAQKEYAEARTTYAIVTGASLPGPDELDMRDAAWLGGLAETVGELRRQLLDVLRAGHLERCEELLESMDDIYSLLVTIDFPDGITGGLRRATDIARSIIERTRGDLTNALVQARLRDALDAHRTDLLGSALPGE